MADCHCIVPVFEPNVSIELFVSVQTVVPPVIVPATETGLTVIWPADWMFLHKGVVAKKEEKFIITGWFSFIE